MTARNMVGDGVLYTDEEYLPLWWDNENIYYKIDKPTEEVIKELESFNINSPTTNYI